MLKTVFKYFEPAWTGNDGKVSLRSILAASFSIDFIRNLNYAITKWEIGRSLEGLSLVMGIEAGLVVGLLGLSTYQNLSMFNKQQNSDVNDSQNQSKNQEQNQGVEQPGT